MRTTSVIFFVASILAPFASADLHTDGVCVDRIGGSNVYNAAATEAACTAYLNRNTGNKQWDQCPDCTMVSHKLILAGASNEMLIRTLESDWKLECLPF